MKLHTLDIQAFGPFGGRVSVDFDELGQQGLFLFTGPTGSGKSSVLDAVCFALYGVVPGTRHAARQLRSDHADPDVPPEVTLEFSVGSRRFRSRRSPAWERPKRRGAGMTTQPASVVLEECQGQAWHTLTTRLDDAGDLIVRLLGMQAGQFTQVVLLPQGDFQKFLGARSDDRQAILQRLFNTDRFARVETWLRERRLALARETEARQDAIKELIGRVEEVLGRARPTAWESTPFPILLRHGDLGRWSLDALAECEQTRTDSSRITAALEQQLGLLVSRRDEAALLRSEQQRGARARATLELAQQQEPETTASTARLQAHRRAVPVQAVARQRQAAREDLTVLGYRTLELLTRAGLPHDADEQSVRARHRAAQRRQHAIEEFLPRQEILERATAQLTDIAVELRALDATIPESQQLVAEMPARRSALDQQILRARLAAQDQQRAQAELVRTEEARAAAVQLVEVRAQGEAVNQQVLTATARHQTLREVHQDLREARINAMAGELAAGLAAGCSCPVCGSESHPAPAPANAVVNREEEDAARSAVDDAAITLETVRDQSRTLQHEIAALEARSEGLEPAEWQRRLQTAQQTCASLAELAATLPSLDAERERLVHLEEEHRARLASESERQIALRTQQEGLEESIATLKDAVAAVLDGIEADSVAGAHRLLADELAGLDLVLEALERQAEAQRNDTRLAETLARESVAAGFASWADVERALLGEDEVDAIERELAERADQLASARATLAEPDVAAALGRHAPDLDAIDEALADAQRRRDNATAAVLRAQTQTARLRELAEQVQLAIGECLPVLDEHDRVAALADLLEGKSADNEFRVRLSAHVLSERLRAVVHAANDQLTRMGLERFTLEQSDAGNARDRRGGLGLRVRDSWTSTLRETGTLSGGETFMVSLALALGLSDTVTAEAGGMHIGTLFVDEGFGSLDSEALEGVMDTLDALRDGGRAVGVVSHVTEMRERIPAQVRVSASDTGGSTLQISLG